MKNKKLYTKQTEKQAEAPKTRSRGRPPNSNSISLPSRSKSKQNLKSNSKSKENKTNKTNSNLFLNKNKKRLRSEMTLRRPQKVGRNNINVIKIESSDEEEIQIEKVPKKLRLDSKGNSRTVKNSKTVNKNQNPKKVKIIEFSEDESEIESHSEPKGKRGRPRKTPDNKQKQQQQEQSKKKSVRPRKSIRKIIKIESSDEEEESSEEISVVVNVSSDEISEEPVKSTKKPAFNRKSISLSKTKNNKVKAFKSKSPPRKEIRKTRAVKVQKESETKAKRGRPKKLNKVFAEADQSEEEAESKGESRSESSVISISDQSEEKTKKKLKPKKASSSIKTKKAKARIKNESEEIEEEESVEKPSKGKRKNLFGVEHDAAKSDNEAEIELSLNESVNEEIKEENESATGTLNEEGKEKGQKKQKKIKAKKEKKPNKPKVPKQPKIKKPRQPKPKKVKVYTKYTKGKFNPAVEIIDKSECLDSDDKKIIDECCVACNNRNIIRAANTNNFNLFQDCVDATNKISSLFGYWSADSKQNIFNILIKNKNKEFLTEVIKFIESASKKKTLRVHKPEKHRWNMDTGSVSYQTFGTYTRKLNMSRGNRMGINAFTEDESLYFDMVKSFLKALYLYCSDVKFLQYLEALLTALKNKQQKDAADFASLNYGYTYNSYGNQGAKLSSAINFTEKIHAFALHGNRTILNYLIRRVARLSYYGYNSLHSEVLVNQDGNFLVAHRASVNKKSNEFKLTPVHFAALNPCGDVLKNLVQLGGDLNFPDSLGNKAIHFAAVCEGPGPLAYLASLNANFEELNQKKYTPLLLACKFGRLENVKLICNNPNIKLYHKNKKGMNAICLAAKYNHFKIIEYLVKEKGYKIDSPGKDRRTALMFAAGRGHTDTVKLLLELGAKVTKKDKFKRSPLIFSVKSGQAVITSILLRGGAEPNAPDSSNNFPLHYACAYGWKENISLLLKAGADINSICDWNITPLELCILQKHTGLVFYLLENSGIDVNSVLYGGNTLMHRYMENLSPEVFEDLKYLIEKKKANLNVINNEGRAPIHYLAEYTFQNFATYFMENKNLEINNAESLKNSVYSFYAYDTKNKIASGDVEFLDKINNKQFNASGFYNMYSGAVATASDLYRSSAFIWEKYFEFINKVFELFMNNGCKINLGEELNEKGNKEEIKTNEIMEEEIKQQENKMDFIEFDNSNNNMNNAINNPPNVVANDVDNTKENSNPNSQKKKPKNPIFLAIANHNYPFIEKLLELNYDIVEYTDENDNTIFHILCDMLFDDFQKNEPLMDFILSKCKEKDTSKLINKINKQGCSPIIQLFLNYNTKLSSTIMQIEKEETLKLKLEKFQKLYIKDRVSLYNHICKVKKVYKKLSKGATNGTKKTETNTENNINPLPLIDNITNPTTDLNTLNFNNNIPIKNNFGGFGFNARHKFSRPAKRRWGGKRKYPEENEDMELDDAQNNQVDPEKEREQEEQEAKKLLENVDLEIHDEEEDVQRTEIDLTQYKEKLKQKLELEIHDKFSKNKFFEGRKIFKNLKSAREMDIEDESILKDSDAEFLKTIRGEDDCFDKFIDLGFILNNNSITLTEQNNIKYYVARKRIEKFIQEKILKMFRELVNLGGDYNAKIRKIDTKIKKDNQLQQPSQEVELNTEVNKSTKDYEVFDDKNDIYYYQNNKRWNILLLISNYFSIELLEVFVEEFKIDVNYFDPMRNNIAFLLARVIDFVRGYDSNNFIKIMKQLLVYGLDINHKNLNGENLFHYLGYTSINSNMLDLKFLAENNVDINSLDKSGNNLLLKQLKNASYSNTNKTNILQLIENFNFDINKQDEKLRSFLHYLIICLKSSADVDVSLLQKILSLGADCNLKDIYGRTPLHYLFLENNNELCNFYIDPIVYLSTLLEIKEIETNVPDYLGNIPLHYAAMRGSTICAMSLFNKEFINFKNKEGNTPLAYALIFDQVNIATYLFQQNSNIDDNVFPLKERNIEKYLKEQEKEAKRLSLVESKNQDNLNSKENGSEAQNLMDLDENEKEDSEDKSFVEEEDELYEEEVNYNQNTSNAFRGFGRFAMPAKRARRSYNNCGYNSGFGRNSSNYGYLNNESTNEIFKNEKGEYEESISIFRFTVKKNYQGLMYLFVNSGFDLMIAIQECIVQKMINLALLLLDKSPYDKVYQKLNNKQQNLFHILAINCNSEILNRGSFGLNDIFEKLFSKGIDLYLQDYQGYTPLHYACENSLYDLVVLIITKVDLKKNNSLLSNKGLSPFLCFMKKLIFSDYEKFIELFQNIDLFNDMNLIFNEDSFGPNYKCSFLIYILRNFNKLEEFYQINYFKPKKTDGNVNNAFNNFGSSSFAFGSTSQKSIPPNKLRVGNQNFTNIFSDTTSVFYNEIENTNNNSLSLFGNLNNNNNINANPVKQTSLLSNDKNVFLAVEEDNPKNSIFTNTQIGSLLKRLVSFGANVMQKDSDGLDVLFYCVKENNYELIKFILKNFKGQIEFDQVENEGKSLLHYVVSPIKNAFYENEKILRFLISNGFKYDLKDKQGKSPLDYAFEKKTDYFLNIFKDLKILSEEAIKVKKAELAELEKTKNEALAVNEKDNYLDYYHEVDYEKDAEFILNENLAKNSNTKENPVLPDSCGNFDLRNNFVVKETNTADNTDGFYDVTLTNVNVMNGIYGQYLFYRMQLIHDVDRNIYILWNRWGMIGETGAYQRTPFISLADAKTEFKKIFKSKTGNEWENRMNFERVYGKYMLLKFKNSRVEYKKLLKPFDFKKLPKSDIKEKSVFELIKEFTNSSLYFKALKKIDIDESNFNIEFLDKNLLNKAEDLLDKVKHTQEELQSFATTLNYDDAIIEKIQKLNMKIYEYSSSYYELIPRERFKNKPVKPLVHQTELAQEREVIQNLYYFENTVKILLGSIAKSPIMNPIDYVLSSMSLKIKQLKKENSEYDLLFNYIKNSDNSAKIKNIFQVEKIGEAEIYNSKWDNLKNKTLLLHGSKVFNFLGILTNGLKICPSEAPCTGLAYGRGIYFSDHFSKSYAYCDYYEYEDSYKNKIRNKYMLICEVALGSVFEYSNEHYSQIHDQSFLKNGFDSLFVKGNVIVNPNKMLTLDSGVKIPSGKYISANSSFAGYSEYIVYDPAQVRIRYVIQTE